jgi:hypothetical protein
VEDFDGPLTSREQLGWSQHTFGVSVLKMKLNMATTVDLIRPDPVNVVPYQRPRAGTFQEIKAIGERSAWLWISILAERVAGAWV